jgi:intein-encoded DNA endonuclease-like protein
MGKNITESIKLRVIELRAEGVSYSDIAQQLTIAKQTAVNIAKENIDEIGTLRAIEVEATFKAQRINRDGRIAQLSQLHQRLREEIERRDLSELPTKDLVALFLKTSDSLKGEVYSPEIRSTEEQAQDRSQRESFYYNL